MLGAHGHKLGDALRALRSALDLSREVFDAFRRVKVQGDLARHLPLGTGMPNGSGAQEKAGVSFAFNPDAPVLVPVWEPINEHKEPFEVHPKGFVCACGTTFFRFDLVWSGVQSLSGARRCCPRDTARFRGRGAAAQLGEIGSFTPIFSAQAAVPR